MQTRMIDNEVKMMRQENLRLAHERDQMVEKIQDNTTKIKQNKVLPYLVSKVVEVGTRAASRPGGADVCRFLMSMPSIRRVLLRMSRTLRSLSALSSRLLLAR